MLIRVILADDHSIVREGLRRVLERANGMEVVGEVETGDGLPPLVRETNADVVVLDINMPGPDFLELIPAITAARPKARVLVMSGLAEEDYALHALRAGAVGYLSKGNASGQLVEAVRRASEGRRYVSESLAERLALGVADATETPPHLKLSQREFEVLRLMGSGLSLKEISGQLKVNPKTISTYRARILSKLGLTTNAELVRYALEHDLIRS